MPHPGRPAARKHRIQRQDVILSDLSDERAYWSQPIAVPGLSYVTLPASAVLPAATDTLSAKDGVLSNGRITVTFDTVAGGVTSLKRDGVEYAGAAAENQRFGVPVLERVKSGKRTDLFDQPNLDYPDWNKAWHKDWVAQYDLPAPTDTRAAVTLGSAQVTQSFTLANGDKFVLDAERKILVGAR